MVIKLRDVNKLKEVVLDLTEGLPKEDRKFALDFLRKHVKLEELHAKAVDLFNKKELVFGSGSKNPTVVVLTKHEIQRDQKNRLLLAFNKMGLEDTDVYFATNNFVVTRKYKEEREQFVLDLLRILKPKVVLSFDGINYTSKSDFYFVRVDIHADSITDKDDKTSRIELNKKFKYLKNIL